MPYSGTAPNGRLRLPQTTPSCLLLCLPTSRLVLPAFVSAPTPAWATKEAAKTTVLATLVDTSLMIVSCFIVRPV